MTDDQPRPPDAPPPDDAPSSPPDAQRTRPTTPSRGGGKGPGAGYPKTLAPREDRIARVWVLAVGAIFLLILVLSALGLPSRLTPEPTSEPIPSFSLEPVPSVSIGPAPS